MAQKDKLGNVWLEIESLIQGRQVGDSRLYDAILLLNQQVQDITLKLQPLVNVRPEGVPTDPAALSAPVNFQAFSAGATFRFTWDQVTYAARYEIRHGEDWDTSAFVLRSSGLSGNIDPLVYGTYTFLIKSLDADGRYSPDINFSIYTVPIILAPAVTIQVVDNNVLLYWTEPDSAFNIDYFVIYKVGSLDPPGKITGTFTTLFELVAGTYTYGVYAVDIAGNTGEAATVTAEVSTPPDFAIQTTFVSQFLQDKLNVLRVATRPSILCLVPAQTWTEHFQNRNWLSPQAQVAASYSIYIQPTVLTGHYAEVFDAGIVLHNSIVTVVWNLINYTPQYSMEIIVKMMVSIDGTTYTPLIEGSSQFFEDFRYLYVILEFQAENDHTLIELYNLTINVSVKRENDGGGIFADKNDVGGTLVHFNKPFKDIESITATPRSVLEPFTVIFDFTDAPNPTSFKVFAFDTIGYRISIWVDWKVRGIV